MDSGVLRDLNRHAAAIGQDKLLVQGAGGNLSGKEGDLVWVKASGTRLEEAEERPIFVGVDGPRAREEVVRVEDLRHVVVELADERASRPSIETALHVLLPHRFVFHVHAVGAIAAGVSREAGRMVERLGAVAPTTLVPYAKPGIGLARAVLAALEETGESTELVVLLGNHGMLTAADTADRARTLIDEVEALLRVRRSEPVLGAAEPTEDPTFLAGPGSVDDGGARFLTGGVLTPDEAVFLGPEPFAGAPGGGARAWITSDGAVHVEESMSEDAREIARSMVEIAALVDPAAPVHYLDEADVAALVDWEAEKWRRGMER